MRDITRTRAVKIIPGSSESAVQAARSLAVMVEDLSAELPRTPDGKGFVLTLVFWAYKDGLEREDAARSGILQTSVGPVQLPENWKPLAFGFELPGKNAPVTVQKLEFQKADRKRKGDKIRVTAETIKLYLVKSPSSTTKELEALFPGWAASSLRRMKTEVTREMKRQAEASAERQRKKMPVEARPARKKEKPASLAETVREWARGQAMNRREEVWKDINANLLASLDPDLLQRILEQSKSWKKYLNARLSEGKKLAREERKRSADAGRRKKYGRRG